MSGPATKRDGRGPSGASGTQRLRALVHILEERCKGCGFCIEFCPRGVFAVSERYNLRGYHPPDIVAMEACTACQLCELLCPDFAIGVRDLGPGRPEPGGRARRAGSTGPQAGGGSGGRATEAERAR